MKSVIAMSLFTLLSSSVFAGTTQVGSAGDSTLSKKVSKFSEQTFVMDRNDGGITLIPGPRISMEIYTKMADAINQTTHGEGFRMVKKTSQDGLVNCVATEMRVGGFNGRPVYGEAQISCTLAIPGIRAE